MHGPKHPDIKQTLEDELYAGLEFIQEIRSRFPTQKILFKYGNHEDRLDRWIVKNCKLFWNIVSLDRQLQLKEYSIEYTNYNIPTKILNTNLYIQHSPPSYSENCANTSLKKKIGASFIYGCTHRMDYACKTTIDGKLQEVYSNGWLGSTDLSEEHARIFSYAKGHQNWQQCFSIVTVIDKTEYHINQIPIKNYKCVVDGNIYAG